MAPKSRSTQSSKTKCNNIAIKPQDKVSPIPVSYCSLYELASLVSVLG